MEVEELFAYISDAPGDGIVSLGLEDKHYPLVFADKNVAAKAKPFVQEIANRAGIEIKLVKSTGLEVVDTLNPIEP